MRKVKILYVGHYSGDTGWGQAARDYILAMDSVGLDVVCREIKLRHNSRPLPTRIRELEAKSSVGCDVVIQHVLPEHMEYMGGVKNIALYVDEVFHTRRNDSVVTKLKMMDEVWCPNRRLRDWCDCYGLCNSINSVLIPHAFDTTKIMSSSSGFNFNKEGNFCFYTIADTHRRKNLVGLIQAFNIAFQPHEPVSLVVKTGSNSMSPTELRSHLDVITNKCVTALSLRKEYKSPIFITERFSDEMITDMHKKLDCFVLPSFGEAWCIPGFEAMAHGKFPVLTRDGGPEDYIDDWFAFNNNVNSKGNGILISGNTEAVIGVENGVDYIYNANNTWCVPSVVDVADGMRQAYEILNSESNESRLRRQQTTFDKVVSEYSYDNIGRLIKHAICNGLK